MAIKFRNASESKWFLYLSKTKLNMLFNQIARIETSKRSTEWKAGVSEIGSVTRKYETDDESDDYDKLLTVLKELEASGQVGTIYEPNLYVKGILPMRWGLYNDNKTRPDDEAPLVYFSGLDTESEVLLGLGGSSKHCVGFEGSTSTHSRSATPYLVDALLRGLEKPLPDDLDEINDENDENYRIYQAMAIAQHYLRPPTQNLEFFARTLTHGTAKGVEPYIDLYSVKTILATPLYVAMAAPFPHDDHWGLIPD